MRRRREGQKKDFEVGQNGMSKAVKEPSYGSYNKMSNREGLGYSRKHKGSKAC